MAKKEQQKTSKQTTKIDGKKCKGGCQRKKSEETKKKERLLGIKSFYFSLLWKLQDCNKSSWTIVTGAVV